MNIISVVKKYALYAIFLMSASSCADDGSDDFEVFYYSLNQFEEQSGNERELLSAYARISPKMATLFEGSGKGTLINSVCRFYMLINQNDLDKLGIGNVSLEADKAVMRELLEAIEYSGNIYIDCVEPFNLEIKKFRS